MSARQLGADSRGAIMVLGVFMAVFLTAVLYYVIGLGEAIAQREQMQDAADAAAFSAAAVHARGMNVLALINMVMAALLAVLIALKLVETLTTIALVAISVMSFLDFGLAAFIPELSSLREEVHDAGEAWQTQMNVALRALHAGGVAVRDAVPLASELPVIAEVKADYAPRVSAAVVVLTRETLPTTDGTFEELCERAQAYLGEFTRFALGKVVPKPVAGIVGGAVDGLTSAGTGWFCSADDASPPSTTVTRHAHYPALPSRQACLDYGPSRPDYDAAEHNQRCERAERDEQDSEPDKDSGRCPRRCEMDGPYEQRDALARSACAVRRKDDHKLYAFVWQERHFTRSYAFHHGAWGATSTPEQEERGALYHRYDRDHRPCGEPTAPISPEWNAQARDAATGALLPVCSNAAPPAYGEREGETVSLKHVEVLRFFGCKEDIDQKYDLKKYQKDRITADADDDSELKRVPQVLEHGLELGAEAFQLRAVVAGKPPSSLAQRVLEVATWRPRDRRAASSTISSAARKFGRVSMAQAEYFFDVRDPKHEHPDDFMWSMRWKARLKRLRVPERKYDTSSIGDLVAGALETACQTATSTDTGADDGENPGESTCSSDLSIANLFAH